MVLEQIICVAGGTYTLIIGGVRYTLGPIRLGPNWYQLAGHEVNVEGVTEEEFRKI